MDFETVLEKCGSFGRYQLMLLALYGYTNILSSLHYFSQTIISFTPPHRCQVSDSFLPITANVSTASCSYSYNAESEVQCEHWEFEYDNGFQSVTTEVNVNGQPKSRLYIFALLATYTGLPHIVPSWGSVLGTIFFGYLADRIGRLPACVLASLTGGLGDYLTSFVYTLPAFCVTRFISGLSTDTLYYLMYILVFEYLSPKRRTFGLNIMLAVFYCSGLMLSPWLAIWVGDWRHYLWIASLPVLGVLLYPCLLFESAEWLLTKQRYERAAHCLRRIAKINGRQVPEQVFEQFQAYYKNKTEQQLKFNTQKDTFMDMFRTPRLRKFTIILTIKSMIITIAFDIISRNMEGLGSSPFMLFSFTSLSYLPSGLCIILLQNYIGRKGMACASLLVGGLITALTGYMVAILPPADNAMLLAFMVGLGRFGSVVAYDAEAQYAAEIIPTSVRGRGMSNIHVAGYAFSFFSPYIIYLGSFYKPLPSLFISLLMFIGAALCLALPETLNKKLSQTLADGESFGLGEKWYFFPCLQRKKSQPHITELTVATIARVE